MIPLPLELLLVAFVAPIVALFLILAIAHRLRHRQEYRSRRAAAHHRPGVGFNRAEALRRIRDDA